MDKEQLSSFFKALQISNDGSKCRKFDIYCDDMEVPFGNPDDMAAKVIGGKSIDVGCHFMLAAQHYESFCRHTVTAADIEEALSGYGDLTGISTSEAERLMKGVVTGDFSPFEPVGHVKERLSAEIASGRTAMMDAIKQVLEAQGSPFAILPEDGRCVWLLDGRLIAGRPSNMPSGSDFLFSKDGVPRGFSPVSDDEIESIVRQLLTPDSSFPSWWPGQAFFCNFESLASCLENGSAMQSYCAVYVPSFGRAESLGGEILRAVSGLTYRYDSNGDRFYVVRKGYRGSDITSAAYTFLKDRGVISGLGQDQTYSAFLEEAWKETSLWLSAHAEEAKGPSCVDYYEADFSGIASLYPEKMTDWEYDHLSPAPNENRIWVKVESFGGCNFLDGTRYTVALAVDARSGKVAFWDHFKDSTITGIKMSERVSAIVGAAIADLPQDAAVQVCPYDFKPESFDCRSPYEDVYAESRKDAEELYGQGQYNDASERLKQLAVSGDRIAAKLLANCYYYLGEHNKAYSWWVYAASCGEINSLANLFRVLSGCLQVRDAADSDYQMAIRCYDTYMDAASKEEAAACLKYQDKERYRMCRNRLDELRVLGETDSLEEALRTRFADEKDAQPSFSTEVHGKTIAVTFSCGKVEMFVAIDAARFKERMVDIVQLFYGKWLRQQGRDDEAPEAIITRGREWYVYASYGFVPDETWHGDVIPDYNGVFAFKPFDCGVAWTKEELKYRKSQFLKLNAPILLEDGEFSAVTVGTPNKSIRIVGPHKPWMSVPWEYWVNGDYDNPDAFFRFYCAPAPEKDFKGKKEVLITDSFAARHIGTSGGDGYQVIIGEEEMGLSMEAICSLVDGYRAQGMDVMICNDEKDESRCITYGTAWISKDVAPARAYQLDVCSTALLSVDVMDEKKPAIILRPQVEWFSNTDEARDKLWHKAHTSYSGYEYTELDSSLCNGTSFISEWEPLTTAYMNILTHEGALNEKGKAVRKTFNIDKLTRDDRLRLDVEMAYGDEERLAYCRTALLEYLLKKKGLGSLSGEINKLPDYEAEIWRLADILDIPINAGVRQRWLLKKGVDSLSAAQVLTVLDDFVATRSSTGGEYMISSASRYYADYRFRNDDVGSGSPGCSIDQYGKRYGTMEEFATALIFNFAEGRLTVSDEALMDNGYLFMIIRDELDISPDSLLKSDPSFARRLEIIDLSATMVNKITRDMGIGYKTVSDTLCAMRVADKLPFTLADLKDLRDSGWDYDFSHKVTNKIYSFLDRTGRSQTVLMKLINSDNLRAVKYAYDIACEMRDCHKRKMVLDAYHERFKDKR